MKKDKKNDLGIASLVLGICSILFCWIGFFGLVCGIVGLIFSSKQKNIYPNGITTGGMVTSIIGTIFSGIYTIIWMLFGALFATLL
jgi:hypothetical protein